MTYKSQTLSAIIITENNAATLERALSSLQWVDELVVVDRGSTDGTLAIARGFTDRVLFHPSKNPTVLRRDALASATSDWLLLIEPDEWVEEMLRHEIDGVMLNTPAHLNGYTIPRKLRFQNRWYHIPLGDEPQRALRLVRKNHWEIRPGWNGELRVGGDVGRLDRPLGYEPYATVEDIFSAMNRHSTLAAYRQLAAEGVRSGNPGFISLIWNMIWSMVSHFCLHGAIFTGVTGLIFSTAHMVNAFLKQVKIRALLTK